MIYNKEFDLIEFSDFVDKGVSPFHVVNEVKEMLKDEGFSELEMTKDFEIKKGGKYFIDVYDSSLIAFTVGKDFQNNKGIRITSSHTDFPCFKIKPNMIMKSEVCEGLSYIKLNTEVYGGPILNTWLDRPLAIAGRVVLKGEDAFSGKTILLNSKRNLLTIPNLAIHMNRDVNKGVELNKQKDMLPVIGLNNKFENDLDKQEDILEMIFEEDFNIQGINKEDILDYELYIYSSEEGCELGLNEEMFQAPRLDNLTSVYAETKAITKALRNDGINVAMYFDNEEIGSKTKQGAASNIMMLLLEKIYNSMGYERQKLLDDLLKGTMISCDVAHALHPNSPEKSDPTNKVMLNNGIVIKLSAVQSYSNDAIGTSIIKHICKENEVPYQVFVNKSDMAGGQTLGAISSTIMPIRTMDIGIPLLAMHSVKELMGIKDQKYLEKFLTGFYS